MTKFIKRGNNEEKQRYKKYRKALQKYTDGMMYEYLYFISKIWSIDYQDKTLDAKKASVIYYIFINNIQ